MGKEYYIFTKAPPEELREVLIQRGYTRNNGLGGGGSEEYLNRNRSMYLELKNGNPFRIDEMLRLFPGTSIPYPKSTLVTDLDSISLMMGIENRDKEKLPEIVLVEFDQIREQLKVHKTEIQEIDNKGDNERILLEMRALGVNSR